MRLTVEVFGIPESMVADRQIEVDLGGDVTLGDVVGGLRLNLPDLDGRVFVEGENKLTRHYGFNVNGRFHVDDYDFQVGEGDRIVLITYALGG